MRKKKIDYEERYNNKFKIINLIVSTFSKIILGVMLLIFVSSIIYQGFWLWSCNYEERSGSYITTNN